MARRFSLDRSSFSRWVGVVVMLTAVSCTRSGQSAPPPPPKVVKVAKPTMPPVPKHALKLEGEIGRLVASFVALPDELPTNPDLRGYLAVPKGVTWPARRRGYPMHDVEIPVDGHKVTLRLFYRAGTWETPRGNGPMPMGLPELRAAELLGPRGLPSPFAADTPVHDFLGRMMQMPKVGLYFEQGTPLRQWRLARYPGRAPFHLLERERREIEATLIALSDVMHDEAQTPTAYMAAKHADRRGDTDKVFTWYKFGSGRIGVSDLHVKLDAVGYLPLGRFFEHNDIKMIRTSFAHDYGQMVHPIEAKDFTVHLTAYGFNGRYGEVMGSGKDAEVMSMTFSAKPGQVAKEF